jgi:hypothetical protein
LHPCFQWDDTIAAHEYRLNQASDLIRNVQIVVYENDDEESHLVTVRAFPNVINEDSKHVYVSASSARNNEYYWQQIKDQAITEIKAWQAKYKAITAFEVLFDAIEAVLK